MKFSSPARACTAALLSLGVAPRCGAFRSPSPSVARPRSAMGASRGGADFSDRRLAAAPLSASVGPEEPGAGAFASGARAPPRGASRGGTDFSDRRRAAAPLSASVGPDELGAGAFSGGARALPGSGGGLLSVLSAALLITSNEVGASMMVLPGLCAGPGMAVSSGLIACVYVVNLCSGLLIAEVAINQYEASSCEVPSSFKELADANLRSGTASDLITAVSLFVNACVLSYDLTRAGEMATDAAAPLLGAGTAAALAHSHVGLFLAAASAAALVSSVGGARLSAVASVACAALFACFVGLVAPGLAAISAPAAVWAAPGTDAFGSAAFAADVSTFVPVLLTTMTYMNIVPTVAKTLAYDRTSIVAA
eukprot:CAMPEP_0194275450 /NCGR_PEP_ID=MMETSP0169-20130528/8284_1 /TAXON_ID=218684 /ORGANISM="Corethron pennatum, Strain L29A3" /LENGTH=366 /DNA_ID=CAMNT_0039018911 /DNA_START=94 /DNA_END=1190 /DNA_ORIENTATION=-